LIVSEFICDAVPIAGILHIVSEFICDAVPIADILHIVSEFICDAVPIADILHIVSEFIYDAVPIADILYSRMRETIITSVEGIVYVGTETTAVNREKCSLEYGVCLIL
jgi:hypothetical protein